MKALLRYITSLREACDRAARAEMELEQLRNELVIRDRQARNALRAAAQWQRQALTYRRAAEIAEAADVEWRTIAEGTVTG